MAHVGDKCDVCQRHDLLPLRCDLCSLRCCTEHIPPAAHDCKGTEDNVSSSRPEAVGLGAALKAEMAAVVRRFEGQEWSAKEHFKVKSTTAALAQSATKENKYLKAYRARVAAGGGGSDKARRVSQQVRRMLIKSKATGRSNLHHDDRFYLEVRFGGLDAGDGTASSSLPQQQQQEEKEAVDYVFVSRLWTLGRVLDEITGKHGAALRKAYPDADEGYSFLSERTGRPLLSSLGRAMVDFDPERELADTDALVLLPAAAVKGGSVGDEGQQEEEPDTAPPSPPAPPDALAAAAVEEEGGVKEEAGEGAAAAAAAEEVTLTVTQGKTAHAIAFSAEAWRSGALTIGDLKARVAALTGVRPERQKLLFKGLLGDASVPLAATQLRDGSKVVLMGGSRT